MISIYRKEIQGFFSNLTGYIVIIVFLLANSIVMWLYSGNLNILDAGYATIEPLFIISPWIFLFLVPAITMRTFAEEQQSGTLGLLLSRPLTDLQIVIAKYLASVTLLLFSLLPCLIFFFSVYLLGNPQGNIDTGGTWGSMIGLFFLGAVYVSIGMFSSSLTDNMIVAFLMALVLCFVFYIGFDKLAQIQMFSKMSTIILYIGINEHYMSMSRGVIDMRDIIYFVSIVSVFILLTRTRLASIKW
ncbi:MAG TPA: gliding motility-associated ABC transporter permease subunit GldF [Bacteroidales bacterium]|nr:gliding motility-associated ABC transporter permease subunit GldF [Bacteroidales bacterium]